MPKYHLNKSFFQEPAKFSANGVNTSVKRGDIFLSLPCDIHRIVS